MNPMRGVRQLHVVFGQWVTRRPREPERVFLEEAVRISVPKQSAEGDAANQITAFPFCVGNDAPRFCLGCEVPSEFSQLTSKGLPNP